jgi:hypothetical protein
VRRSSPKLDRLQNAMLDSWEFGRFVLPSRPCQAPLSSQERWVSLESQLLRGDRRLEAAAVSDPAHITPGSRGSHVAKIQTALNRLDGAGLSIDGIYSTHTASAV